MKFGLQGHRDPMAMLDNFGGCSETTLQRDPGEVSNFVASACFKMSVLIDTMILKIVIATGGCKMAS